MTVISAVLASDCLAVATDSYRTVRDGDRWRVVESEQTKIIPFERKRAAISYWGLDECGSFSTFDFITSQVSGSNNNENLFEWSERMGAELQARLDALRTDQTGIGIHITGFERVADYWVPELILCSNYTDPTYTATGRIALTRRSFRHVSDAPDNRDFERHGQNSFRMRVKNHLDGGSIVYFNNGDPVLFNPFANAVLQGMGVAKSRRCLNMDDSARAYRQMLLMCVSSVADMQTRFYDEGQRIVGGRPHNLSITSSGIFESDTGDA